MHPLLWLAIPLVVTAMAAEVLLRRESRAPDGDSDAELRRMARALAPRDDGGR
ncbi:MAG: hypothetical protein U0R64_11130 [Candidatus Nanopelagicales bacterium]